MKQKGMKVLSLSALFLVILAGCQKQQPQQSQQQGGGAGLNANMSNLNTTGFPIVKEKESFSLLVDDNGKPEEKGLYDILEKETNVHADLMLFPYQAALERKNILIASGNYPDVIGGWLLTNNDVMNMAKEGMILPLEDLIEKYTVNIKEALNYPGVRDTMTLPDGHIYSPPYVIGEPLVSFLPFINTKWLADLGLSMPTTTEEFKNVLMAFRDRIPPVNGQKIIPFSGDPNNLNLGTLAGWFGLNASGAGSNAGYFAVINGQVENTVIRPEYQEFIKYFADLYANGLIDPELFTQDNAAWKAKGLQGLYGVSIAYGAGDFAAPLHNNPSSLRFDYEPLPVLKAPNVSKPVFRRNGFGVSIFRTQMVITDKAANPITIIRWLDNVYSEQHSIECDYGPIGLKFEKLPDGQYQEIDTTDWPEEKTKQYEWGRLWTVSMPKFRRPGYKLLPPEGKNSEYPEKDIADALYAPYLEETPMPALWIAEEKLRRSADIEQALTAYVRQKQAEWVSGQASIDAEWDAYVAQLNRLGLQELLQIKRDAMPK
ncbi:MAG: extracellular solute-binding protein [Treponema sp.]|jgi:putative aldouronate transport system substrate-binding protein|nr:extracellular solute-binding protein [Treponema sp.]